MILHQKTQFPNDILAIKSEDQMDIGSKEFIAHNIVMRRSPKSPHLSRVSWQHNKLLVFSNIIMCQGRI